MDKNIILLGLISLSSLSLAQHKKHHTYDNDSLKVREIEDIRLHKHGNPNKAKIFSDKSNLDIMENPQQISIVTHEVIEQQQARQLSEVLKNVNGIYITSSRGGSQDSFGGRGFIFRTENIFKNGARVNSGVFPEVTGLECVEVMKGANAMLYGNVGPGGIVNMITKKPRFHFGGSMGMNMGSWNTFKPMIDIFGPISKNVAFRMNGTYEYADSFRDIVNSQKHYFNPSFAFNIGENTQIFVEGDYLKHHFTPDFGTGSLVDSNTGIASFKTGLKRNQFLGEDWNYQTNEQTSGTVTLNHKFNNNWHLNSVGSYQNFTRDYFSFERIQWIYNGKTNSTPTWKRILNRTYNEQNYASFQINLNGEFSTGKLKHKTLLGADADYNIADAYTYYNPNTGKTFGTSYTVGQWQLNKPNSWISSPMPLSEKEKLTQIKTTRYGVYAQDLIEFNQYIKVLAGLRYSEIKNDDTFEKNYKTRTEEKKQNSATSEHAFSPKVGLIITPNQNFTIYGTYTNSFMPNTGFDIKGNPLKASIVDQYEIGIKKNILDDAVAFNFNIYQITNRNTYVAPFLDSGATALYRVFAGNVRSRGAELDITGNPTKQLTLIGGVSYNNAVYINTPKDGFVENQRLVRTPAVTANASAFYKFDHFAKGLILGATATYTGDRKAGWNDIKGQPQVTRMIDLKGYTSVDFSIGYEYKGILLQGKVGNAFDVENWNVHENYSINPIMPRNYYITLTYKL